MIALNEKNCDIYVGNSCGKMVWDHIVNAHESIKIISPYIEPEFLKILEQKHCEGIDVELLTSEEPFKKVVNNKTTILNFIRQVRTENERNKKKFKSLIMARNIVYILALLLFIYYFYKPILIISSFKKILVVIGILLVAKIISYVASKTQVYFYSYSTTFPIKFYANPYYNNLNTPFFIHSKIYIIDDVVFLGSFNFTKSGFWHQFETRVKIKDENVIRSFYNTFVNIANREDIGYFNLGYLAKPYFREPIN